MSYHTGPQTGVGYEVVLTDGQTLFVENPSNLPNPSTIDEMREPWASIDVITPSRSIGQVMELTTSRRGKFLRMEYLEPESDVSPG